MKYVGCALALVCLVALAACGDRDTSTQETKQVSAADVQRQTEEAVETAKAYAAQQKEAFQKRIEARIDSLDAKIDDLRARLDATSGAAKTEMQQSIETLRQKQHAAGEKLAELRDASTEAWQDVEAGVSNAVDELQQAYDRAKAKFQ